MNIWGWIFVVSTRFDLDVPLDQAARVVNSLKADGAQQVMLMRVTVTRSVPILGRGRRPKHYAARA